MNKQSDLRKWLKEKWVRIDKTVDGKHPPCGRSDADKGDYPKCRPAAAAAKMTKSEKQSASIRKERAEKTKKRKGKKPIYVATKKASADDKQIIIDGKKEAMLLASFLERLNKLSFIRDNLIKVFSSTDKAEIANMLASIIKLSELKNSMMKDVLLQKYILKIDFDKIERGLRMLILSLDDEEDEVESDGVDLLSPPRFDNTPGNMQPRFIGDPAEEPTISKKLRQITKALESTPFSASSDEDEAPPTIRVRYAKIFLNAVLEKYAR